MNRLENLGNAMLAMMHNGELYSKATKLLNSSIGEKGFHIWVDLPDGSQFVIPKGSKIRILNYVPAIKD